MGYFSIVYGMVNEDFDALESQFETLVDKFEQRLQQIDGRIAHINDVCDKMDKLIKEREKWLSKKITLREILALREVKLVGA